MGMHGVVPRLADPVRKLQMTYPVHRPSVPNRSPIIPPSHLTELKAFQLESSFQSVYKFCAVVLGLLHSLLSTLVL